jgi:hypothetical protein
MSLIPVFNKNSPWAYTESKLDVLGVHRKLVKYVVYLSKRKIWKKNYFSSHKLPKQQSTNFWSQGILGVKWYSLVKHFLGQSNHDLGQKPLSAGWTDTSFTRASLGRSSSFFLWCIDQIDILIVFQISKIKHLITTWWLKDYLSKCL